MTAGTPPSGADETAPVFASAAIAANGTDVTVTFDEAVTVADQEDDEFNLDCDGASGADVAMAYSSGSGTAALVFTTGATVIQSTETCNVDAVAGNLAAGEFQDGSGNSFTAGFTDEAVTNGSEQGGSAPAFVSYAKASDDGYAASITTDTTLPILDNHAIVAFIAGSGFQVTSLTCGSNTLAKKGELLVDDYYYSVWTKEGASAGTTTCTANYGTLDNSGYRRILVGIYSGVATSSAVDKVSCNNATCDAVSSSSANKTAQNVTTTTNGQLAVFSHLNWNNNGTFSGANSYNLRSAASGVNWSFADKVLGNAGDYPSGTVVTDGTASDTYVSLYITLKVQ